MRSRGRACVWGALLALLGVGCSSSGSETDGTVEIPGLVILEPVDGVAITAFSFQVRVEVDGSELDPASVRAELNDVGLELDGGPSLFTAAINPGWPLRDSNRLNVHAQRTDGATVTVSRSFQYLPPKARARRITDPADLIHGPLAHGRIDDYLLENARARFIVQDVGQRDLYSVGAFGGNIIDAELVGRPGLDNFIEIQPAVNIETVINAQVAEIVNDGEDGTAAIIRTCGPDDLLDFVNPSTIIEGAGLTFPPGADDTDYEIEGCTDYVLEPETTRIRMTTTVFNNEDVEHGFFVGDYVNASGEVEQWTTSGGGIGELLVNSLGLMSYIGYGEGSGVDYSLLPIVIPGVSIPRSTFFSVAGVAYIMHSNSIVSVLAGGPATFKVPPGGSNSFTRYFAVGDGSGSNAVEMEAEVRGLRTGTLRGCVTAGSEPAAGARVSVLLRGLVSQFVTGADGCYGGRVPVGTYRVAGSLRGFSYEGGGREPLLHTVTIDEDGVTVQDIALPPSGRLRAHVVDQEGRPIPARIAVVGFDPSPEPILTVTGFLGADATGMFNDLATGAPFGIVWLEYAGADGTVEFDLEPGSYQVVASRGSEYSAFSQPLTLQAGETAVVNARIAHVIDTAGFVSSDFHVHGIHSADSRVSHTDRALQFAGEGVDNIIMTDHHVHTDLLPRIRELGLAAFVHATIGEEITTWDYGHFNAYPLLIDPARPSGGSTDWAGAAPPGRDFPIYGAFGLTPAEIAAEATGGATSTADTTIQINHINSFFEPLRIDTSMVPPQSFISAADKLRFRLDPQSGDLFHHFPALELWNGASRGAQREFLLERIGIWMNHLNQGLLTTAIADTDTHQFRNLTAAGARTWTAAPDDRPEHIVPGQVARAVAEGRAVGGQGVYVQTRLVAADGSGGAADLTFEGDTIVSTSNGAVDLQIRVQAPAWARFDRIEVYANAETTVARQVGGIPVLFGASPSLVLQAGPDFTVGTVDVFPAVPGAQRLEANLTVPFRELTQDTWFVVVAKGTDGVSEPMFPIMVHDLRRDTNTTLADLLDGNLNEAGVLALGFSNALYADVDGVPGFQAPLVR